MKKFILGLAVAVLIMSCSNDQSKMKSEIKTYLDKNAKDPKSYEFVDLKIIDTVTDGILAKDLIESNKYLLETNQELLLKVQQRLSESIENVNKYGKDFQKYVDDRKQSIDSINKSIIEYKKTIQENNKLTNSKIILGYVVEHNYRLKNGFGALDLSKSYINFDKDFKLLDFNDNINYSIFKQ